MHYYGIDAAAVMKVYALTVRCFSETRRQSIYPIISENKNILNSCFTLVFFKALLLFFVVDVKPK